jgi:hypothetical protein
MEKTSVVQLGIETIVIRTSKIARYDQPQKDVFCLIAAT